MHDTPAVVDEDGSRYRLGPQLGCGGQGRVHALVGERFAVKLLLDRSPERREALRERLAHVRRLDLAGLPIARPLALLRRPHVGYIMELLTGMRPLQRLLAPPPGGGSALAWYRETGGLRRRLHLLARIAEVLSAVHGRGLAYGDPSPHNVFVSEASDAHEVRLIDADNLCQSAAPDAGRLHTAGYGAPELVRGTGAINTLTDAHGFAVMAFEALALAHPLLGDAVRDGDPDDEQRALAGELPWIDDPEDRSNASRAGLDRAVVLSPRLVELCRLTFGVGLRAPQARPGLVRWTEALDTAAHSTLRCPVCAWTFYLTQDRCPACDAPRPGFVLALLHLWDPEAGSLMPSRPASAGASPPKSVGFIAVDEQDAVDLPHRLAREDGDATPLLRLAVRGDRLELSADPAHGLQLHESATSTPRPIGERPLTLRLAPGANPYAVHFGPSHTFHRVLGFQRHPGGTR